MKRIPLITQIIIIYSTIFAFMAALGYFVLIPVIETPYVQESYREINYQLEAFADSGIVGDHRYLFITIPSNGSYEFDGSNSMVLRSQPVLLLADALANSADVSGNGYLEIAIQDILYGYERRPDALYLAVIPGEIHPISEDSVLMTQIVLVIMLVFFLPIIFILSWSLLLAKSIKSLDVRFEAKRSNRRVTTISTEIEKLDMALVRYQKEIAANEVEKQELFQNISHELKTPITTIQSYAEGIEDGLFTVKTIRKATDVIQEQTRILLKALNQIMDLNRLTYLKRQEAKNVKSKIDLIQVLDRLIVEYRQSASRRPVQITVDIPTPLFFGDESSWTTCLRNIFDNNIRHGAKKITVSGHNGDLTISNDGETIPEELLSRLFSPFVKGEKGSYGLGLTIIKSSLELNGYSVKIENSAQGVAYIISEVRT